MTERSIVAECENCESSFEINYSEEFVSSETPNFCPFCGEEIENLVDSLDDDEDEEDEDSDDEWKI
jgi:rRNA maturation endonuclease Nob1